ncbi:MAG TPA: AIR synthase-related protein, partial [Thermoanaerobaculia bacterium]|nr:AIR synthase-related protein [Thermoanaerobaculia bacterium]
NETEGRSILPTPAVAMVGVVPSLAGLPQASWRQAGDRVVLLGRDRAEFGGSAYLRLLHDIEQGRPPVVDLAAELALARLLRELAGKGLIHTAHDLSEGGLGIALAEACFGHGLGATVEVPAEGAGLFSESQGRAVIACPPAALDRVLRAAEEAGVPAAEVGEVGGDELVVRAGGGLLRARVAGLYEIWTTALPKALGL